MLEFPKQDILKLVSVVYRKTQMYLNAQIASMGLTGGQTPFLLLACENGRMPQTQIGESLGMDKSSVAKMMSRLEAQGFITRETNVADCRSFDICPTQKAYDIFPLLKQVRDQWAEEMTAGLSDIEQAVFYNLLQKVANNTVEHFI